MRTLRHNLAVIFLIAVIGVPASRAQQDNQQQTPPPPAQSTPDQAATPIPAYHSPLASAADNDDSETPDQDLTGQHLFVGGTGPFARNEKDKKLLATELHDILHS